VTIRFVAQKSFQNLSIPNLLPYNTIPYKKTTASYSPHI